MCTAACGLKEYSDEFRASTTNIIELFFLWDNLPLSVARHYIASKGGTADELGRVGKEAVVAWRY